MAELSELRTRLEGALDRVERMTDSLERAVSHANAGKTGGLTRVLEARRDEAMARALSAVEKLAASEPMLAPVLARFRRADEKVRAALLAQTATLGVYEGDPLELARLLERERPIYKGHAVGWRSVWLGGLLGLYGSLRLTLSHHTSGEGYAYWWVPLLALGVGLVWRKLGPKLVVTPGFVRIGKEVLRVADIRILRITHTVKGFGRSRRHVYEFSAESPQGLSTTLELRPSSVPDDFVMALRTVGVEVRQHDFG